MAPLIPPLVKDKGINEKITGYIFSLYPVGGIIVSLLLGTNMSLERMKKVSTSFK
jgi:predicted MFS family arabinose efflux permease